VTITKKTQIPDREARALVADLTGLNVVSLNSAHIMSAIDLHSRHQLSFWDSLIIIAAKSAGARVLFSEDLGHGNTYEGVRIENPFVTQ